MNMQIRFIPPMLLMVIAIYLFVSAPPPLKELNATGKSIPIKLAMEILNNENQTVRSLYTREIVQAGTKVGLKFAEDWQDDATNAGPLPAQFLRLTAVSLEKSKAPLGLYLGSDYPINSANLLKGKQLDVYTLLKETRKPYFFYVEDIQRYTYMFADVAIAKVCIDCHNKHKDSAKTDWIVNEIMGATTWTYPDEKINLDTLISILHQLRLSFKYAYSRYLSRIKTFSKPPIIGENWPKQGYFLPSLEVFTHEINNRNAPSTFRTISKYIDASPNLVVAEK